VAVAGTKSDQLVTFAREPKLNSCVLLIQQASERGFAICVRTQALDVDRRHFGRPFAGEFCEYRSDKRSRAWMEHRNTNRPILTGVLLSRSWIAFPGKAGISPLFMPPKRFLFSGYCHERAMISHLNGALKQCGWRRIMLRDPAPMKVGRLPMSDLVVIVYPTQEKAEEVRKRLFELQTEYIIKLGDAVIATKSTDGQIQLHQVVNTTASGAVSGSFWGALIGLLFLNPILGAALGAAGGALGGALTDFGINDQFMKQLAESIHPGDAALFVLIREMTADKVLEQIKDYGGVVLKTSLADANEQALRNALAGAVASDPAPPAAGVSA
jgi:uncharacterized membrane protein